MGCVHGKCCHRQQSFDEDMGETSQSKISEEHLITETSLEPLSVPAYKFSMEYSANTQCGYYPGSPYKENQDSFCIGTDIQGNQDIYFFGVFDGHGPHGADCSNFVKDRLVQILANDPTLVDDPVKAYNSAFTSTNDELLKSDIDDMLSGTTAITVLVIGDKIYVANAGDSRAVIAVNDGDRIVAKNLSRDQTPFRKDECERVKRCGARVLTVKQIEGLKDPNIQTWGVKDTDKSDPPRLWVQNGVYPGTAFTRSLGDSIAEEIGVVATPEVSVVQLTPNHLFFVVASDGVFQFLSSQAVVNMVAEHTNPGDACAAISGESYKLWLEHERRTDDITIIVVHIRSLSNAPSNRANDSPAASESASYCSAKSDFSNEIPCQDLAYTSPRLVTVPSSRGCMPLTRRKRISSVRNSSAHLKYINHSS